MIAGVKPRGDAARSSKGGSSAGRQPITVVVGHPMDSVASDHARERQRCGLEALDGPTLGAARGVAASPTFAVSSALGQRRAPGHARVAAVELVDAADDCDRAPVASFTLGGHSGAEVDAPVVPALSTTERLVERLRQAAAAPIDLAQLLLPVDAVAVLGSESRVARGPRAGRDDRRRRLRPTGAASSSCIGGRRPA